MIAAGAMAASSLSVVMNANRLRGFEAPVVGDVEGLGVTGPTRVEVGEREPIRKEETMTTVTDLVCGMEIDPATAAASEEYRGTIYYVAATRYMAQPEKYAA
jgi:P-type Cu+ transporter